MLLLIIAGALVLDQLLGEPKRFHPLVGFGALANTVERLLNVAPHKPSSIFKGVLAVILLITIPVFIAVYFVLHFPKSELIIEIAVLYWAIGLNSLIKHTKPIFAALNDNDLELAKTKVGFIVSRNTQTMNKTEVVSATVESTLENGCDGVFAALFWSIIGGAPCVIAYRLINTLDAMWGYRSQRFNYFGKAAAVLDDVVNFIPARLTALSYALLGNFKLAIHCWRNQALLLSSPNGGPVMCAGAGSLNIKLGGPAFYHNQCVDKPYFGSNNVVDTDDISRANRLVINTALLWCFILLAFEIANAAL